MSRVSSGLALSILVRGHGVQRQRAIGYVVLRREVGHRVRGVRLIPSPSLSIGKVVSSCVSYRTNTKERTMNVYLLPYFPTILGEQAVKRLRRVQRVTNYEDVRGRHSSLVFRGIRGLYRRVSNVRNGDLPKLRVGVRVVNFLRVLGAFFRRLCVVVLSNGVVSTTRVRPKGLE